jgi:hypothetical protein
MDLLNFLNLCGQVWFLKDLYKSHVLKNGWLEKCTQKDQPIYNAGFKILSRSYRHQNKYLRKMSAIALRRSQKSERVTGLATDVCP